MASKIFPSMRENNLKS